MNNYQRVFFSFLIVFLLVGVSTTGGLYLIHTYNEKYAPKPLKPEEVIPGFKKEANNQIPLSIPETILFETDGVPVDSYTRTNGDLQESSYTYISKLHFTEAYMLYSKNLKHEGYVLTSQIQKENYYSGTFEKPGIKVLISVSYNLDQKITTVTITSINQL